jgi:8-oxo-dGTP diphosphatase/2-hydroxy-dATP diphosphatase
MEEKDYSLVFCRRTVANGDNQVLLGMKKRGFGVGKWNGYGGKLEPTETIEQCAVRELEEECGLVTADITRKGYLVFKMLELNMLMRVHVYETWKFSGDAVETEEMRPQWYRDSEVPFDKMWADDKHWLPLVLGGQSIIGRYGELYNTIISAFPPDYVYTCCVCF